MLIYQRDLGAASLYIIIYTVVIYLASRKRRILIISLTVLPPRARLAIFCLTWCDPCRRLAQPG